MRPSIILLLTTPLTLALPFALPNPFALPLPLPAEQTPSKHAFNITNLLTPGSTSPSILVSDAVSSAQGIVDKAPPIGKGNETRVNVINPTKEELDKAGTIVGVMLGSVQGFFNPVRTEG